MSVDFVYGGVNTWYCETVHAEFIRKCMGTRGMKPQYFAIAFIATTVRIPVRQVHVDQNQLPPYTSHARDVVLPTGGARKFPPSFRHLNEKHT